MGTFKDECRYKIKISRETFGDFSKERGFSARTWPLLLCVFKKIGGMIERLKSKIKIEKNVQLFIFAAFQKKN